MSLVGLQRKSELLPKAQLRGNHKTACQWNEPPAMIGKRLDTEITREQERTYWMVMVQLHRAMAQIQTSKAIADME